MGFKQNRGDGAFIVADPAVWSALEEKLLVHLMVKEVHNGNRSATTFSRKGWVQIEQEFFDRTGKRYSNLQIRNKFNQLRTRYYEFSRLLKQPGFFWDPVQKNILAEDNTWESYIKVNRTAKRFRTKGCPMFSELKIIYGYPTSKFKNVSLAQYPRYNEDKSDDVDDASTNASPSVFIGNNSEEIDEDHPLQMEKRQGQHSLSDEFKESDEEDTGEETPSLRRFEMWRLNRFSITKCVKCLESIEGVDEGTYLKAINMFKDVDWREMFMAMSAERKLAWLASL